MRPEKVTGMNHGEAWKLCWTICIVSKRMGRTTERCDRKINRVMLKAITLGEEWIMGMCVQRVEGGQGKDG